MIGTRQYTPGKICAGMKAASDWGIAVAAHAGTPANVTRASEAGVISIESGMLRDPERNVLVIIKDSEIHKNALRPHGTP
jgi:imidazolonepropionase-like amidohydrolase